MKKAIVFSTLTAAALVGCATIALAQQPKKSVRIGYLSSGNPTSESPRSDGIRQRLRELGYVEGQNVVIEYRHAEGKTERLTQLAAELVHLKVDIIVVTGGLRTNQAAMKATKAIPIVIAGQGLDPVEAGIVKSLAHPGGNVTGITNISGDLGGKRLEVLKEAVDKVTRVDVLYNLTNRSNERELKDELPPAARALKLTLQPRGVRGADDFDRVFVEIGKRRPDALYVLGSPLMRPNRKRIVNFALKSRLPSMHTNTEAVEAGGLMSYGADVADSYRQVAWYIDKILKGTRPADLPVQQPTRFEFVVNLKTAKQIGLIIPQSVLYRANRVIK
jgi:putative ABC transport system substrate-binding protein